jgi:putative thioredoxin
MTFIDGAAPPETDLVIDGSDQGFMADVVEQSRETPVIVDFWAPWCGPCKTLGPPLERAVRKAGGKVRLVKINIDENPGVAGQLGVKSIPAVYAFDQGRPVDGFMGAIPESQIKLFVDRLAGADMTAEIEPLLEQAAESLKLNDIGGAAQAFTAVLQLDQTNIKAIAGMARLAVTTGDFADAEEILSLTPPEKANDPEILGVRAAIELASKAADAGDNDELGAKSLQSHDWPASTRRSALRRAAPRSRQRSLPHHHREKPRVERGAARAAPNLREAAGPMSDVTRTTDASFQRFLFS